MFIHKLAKDEQRAFFGLAKHLIASDGRIAEEEALALKQIEMETGLSSDGIAPCDATDAGVVAALSGKRARAATVLELLGIACADGEFHPAENAVIKSVAAALGVTDDELLWMANWVQRQIALTLEAETFFQEEN